MLRTLFIDQLKPVLKNLQKPFLAAVLAAGFIFTPNNVIDSQAGNRGISTQKFKGHKSSGSVRTIRLGGENQSLRSVSRSFGGGERAVKQRRLNGQGEKIYTRTISVLDGNYGKIGAKRQHITHGRLNNIRRYGKVEYNSSKESRAGVIYHSGKTLRNIRKHNGLQQIAGADNSRITSRRLSVAKQHQPTRFDTFTKGELIAIGVAMNGYYEIAGGGQGTSAAPKNDDCAYGTYCTIDLGGPKIITFNDTGDIRDGELSDDELSDEEYLEQYGTK